MISIQENGDVVISGQTVCPGAFPGWVSGALLARIYILNGTPYPGCWRCKQPIETGRRILVFGLPSSVGAYYCWQCFGLDGPTKLTNREDWLRESAPFVSGAPCYILADWYEEQGRYKDAEWLRTYRSGR